MSLLRDARAAGLTITSDGDRLLVRGPRQAEPLARALGANKAAVLAALADPCLSGPTVLPRAGWTRSAWIANLRRLAARCEQVRPDRAAELRAEADALERDPKLGGPWPAEYSFRPYEAWEREAVRPADRRPRRGRPG